MILGRVVGNLVSTCKWETLTGYKLILVEPIDENLNSIGAPFVALDSIGVGDGEVTLIIESREATHAFLDPNTPTDMGIVGIVDEIKNNLSVKKIH